MTPLRTSATSLVALGALTALMLAGSTADAGDWGEGARITPATSRCAAFGHGFVDLGDGTCGRAGSHVRVQLGARQVAGDSWSAGTSTANLRSEGPEFMPGVGDSHQLRVRNGLQTLSPY